MLQAYATREADELPKKTLCVCWLLSSICLQKWISRLSPEKLSLYSKVHRKKTNFWTIFSQNLVTRGTTTFSPAQKKKCRAVFNYLQGVNWKQIWINLNVKAIQLLQKRRRRKLNFHLFFIVYQVAIFRTFSIVFLCRTHWSDAPTTVIQLVFYFASKAFRKRLLFQLCRPSSGSHKINHVTVDITHSLIYTKSLKTFPYNLRSR